LIESSGLGDRIGKEIDAESLVTGLLTYFCPDIRGFRSEFVFSRQFYRSKKYLKEFLESKLAVDGVFSADSFSLAALADEIEDREKVARMAARNMMPANLGYPPPKVHKLKTRKHTLLTRRLDSAPHN
jgi:hypothetical protein